MPSQRILIIIFLTLSTAIFAENNSESSESSDPWEDSLITDRPDFVESAMAYSNWSQFCIRIWQRIKKK